MVGIYNRLVAIWCRNELSTNLTSEIIEFFLIQTHITVQLTNLHKMIFLNYSCIIISQ